MFKTLQILPLFKNSEGFTLTFGSFSPSIAFLRDTLSKNNPSLVSGFVFVTGSEKPLHPKIFL